MRHRLLSLLATIAVLVVCTAMGAACAAAKRERRAPKVPAHIDTWAFDDGCNGGSGASPSLVRQWVTYAESNCGTGAGKALRDCHPGGRVVCKVMQYMAAEWYFPAEAAKAGAVPSDSWWLHAPDAASSNPIHDPTEGGGYLLNQDNPAVRAFFQHYVRVNYDSSDGLLMDWQSPSLAQELYYSTCGCSKTKEIGSDRALQAAHEAMAAAMTHRNGAPFLQVDNTLPSNPWLPQGLDMLNQAIGVDGWSTEGMPVDNGQLDPWYSTLLDQMAYITGRTTGFMVLLSRTSSGASDPEQARRIQEATVLLGFKPGQIIDWGDFATGNGGLAVWPEEAIVPTDPLQSLGVPRGRGCLAGGGLVCSRGGHKSLEVARGVYRRVFRMCYRRGVRFGPCAAVVNTTGHAIVVKAHWLGRARLRHQVAFVGGDVESGGKIDIRGASFMPGATTVAADDALLLSP